MIVNENGFIFVPHNEWSKRVTGSRGKRGVPIRQANLAKEVYIHHSVTMAQGDPAQIGHLDPSDDPCKDARAIEGILEARNLLPGYSYIVHPSGVVLECAGDYIGAHTGGRNSVSKGIVLIGNFDHQQPTWASLVATARMINLLRLNNKLVTDLRDLKILGHRDTSSTACPGANLYPLIPTIRQFVEQAI